MPASYVDGYVLPLPKKNLAAYRRMARLAARVWKRHGALDYREAALDDPVGTFCATFGQLARARRGETVVFAFVTFKSRAHRDRVNAKVMKDPELLASCDPGRMPFDVKRMAFSGFKVIAASR